MICPTCESKSKVWDVRTYKTEEQDGYAYVQRRHECLSCGERYNSIQVSAEVWATLTNGSEG